MEIYHNILKNKDKVIKILEGLTNVNSVYEVNGESYVLREAGKDTSSFIDRKSEKYNSEIATRLEVYFGDLFFDAESGDKVVKYFENAISIDVNSNEILNEVALLLTKVHRSDEKFKNTFDYNAELSKYESLCINSNVTFLEGYEVAKEFILDTKD